MRGAVERVTYDLIGLLTHLTDIKGWKEVRSPLRTSGVDWFFTAGQHDAWINLDQTALLVEVDGETIYEGYVNDDKTIKTFVRRTR